MSFLSALKQEFKNKKDLSIGSVIAFILIGSLAFYEIGYIQGSYLRAVATLLIALSLFFTLIYFNYLESLQIKKQINKSKL